MQLDRVRGPRKMLAWRPNSPAMSSSGASRRCRTGTWVTQKVRDQGAREDDLSVEVAEHDVERAEDTVQKLERLGIWPR
jgi:hypothetical protein